MAPTVGQMAPAWLLGPALIAIAVGALVFDERLSWWEWVLFPLTAAFGAWGTWMWFWKGENVFNPSWSDPKPRSTDD